jgi:membrane-bound metal-dependent hydrolase YbcI (DUF457 family)
MYAAHFAAALAVKGRVPQAPAWALVSAVFLPDFVWIALAGLGIEPTVPVFFDDWSHSLIMIVVWATVFAALFWRSGKDIALAVWIAGLSHFFLDFLIHPARLALYPHSSVHLGWNLWQYGLTKSWLGATRYWWYELATLAVLLALYVWFSRRSRLPLNLVAASCVTVIGLHMMSLL